MNRLLSTHALWVGDVGNYTVHLEGLGRIPPQGGPQADGETTSERMGRWLVVSPAGGINGGGGITGGGDLRLSPPEHIRIGRCDQAHYVPVYGSGAEAGVKCGQAVVGSERLRLGGDADDRSGGKTEGGGVGDGQDRDGDGLNRWGGYCRKCNIRDGA